MFYPFMKGGDVVLTNEAEFVLLQLYRCYEDDLQDGKIKVKQGILKMNIVFAIITLLE